MRSDLRSDLLRRDLAILRDRSSTHEEAGDEGGPEGEESEAGRHDGAGTQGEGRGGEEAMEEKGEGAAERARLFYTETLRRAVRRSELSAQREARERSGEGSTAKLRRSRGSRARSEPASASCEFSEGVSNRESPRT